MLPCVSQIDWARRASLSNCLVLLLSLVALLGCSTEEPFETKILQCAELPAAFASSNSELVELVKDMQATRSLPRDLERSQLDQATNAAKLLPLCISSSERLNLSERAPWLFSFNDYRLDTELMRDVARILEEKDAMMDRYTKASDQPYCVFEVNHLAGFFGPMEYLSDTQLAVRLLTTRGFDAAKAGEIQRALKDIQRAMRWAHWLSRVKKPEARVLGATLRAEVLESIGHLFNRGAFRQQEAEIIYGMLLDQLTDWPADRRMLEGDRAATAHAYEAIRLGLTKKILSFDEQNQLDRQGKLAEFLEASPEKLDQDEANYLKAMEIIIEASQMPFHSRIEAIERARQNATNEPNLYADRFFLVDLMDAQKAAARDRSLCEAWSLTLSTSAGLRGPNFVTAPINGRNYEVDEDDTRVVVKIGNPRLINPSCPKFN